MLSTWNQMMNKRADEEQLKRSYKSTCYLFIKGYICVMVFSLIGPFLWMCECTSCQSPLFLAASCSDLGVCSTSFLRWPKSWSVFHHVHQLFEICCVWLHVLAHRSAHSCWHNECTRRRFWWCTWKVRCCVLGRPSSVCAQTSPDASEVRDW